MFATKTIGQRRTSAPNAAQLRDSSVSLNCRFGHSQSISDEIHAKGKG
jgi:hypothetical protein